MQRFFGRGNNNFARRVATALLAASLAALYAAPSWAVVLSNGNVFPVDNPLTPLVDEGIPLDGNFIDPFAADPFLTYSNPSDIGVGIVSSGSLLLSGESQLRYGYLVIGGDTVDLGAADAGDPDLAGSRSGRGIVRIEGFGTVFNNDPWIQPYLPFVTIADDNRSSSIGYDIYVGLSGNGTLSINNGGRAESRDGVIVGYGPSSVGLVEVVGLDSYLLASGLLQDPSVSSGTFDPDNSDPILLGTYGSGTLAIRDGGVVDALVGIGLGTGFADGEQPDGGTNTDYGGRGEVVLTGENSLLRVLYSFAIGEFEENDLIPYRINAGQGVVTIGLGSKVTVDTIDGDEPERGDLQVDAEVRIGRFGQLNMDGGRLIAADRLESDGLVRGGGRIDVGYFHNRRQGDVRVGLDQKLLVVSNSRDVAITAHGEPFYMANFGLIEVIGGEIEFDRQSLIDADRFLNFSRLGDPSEPDLRGHIYGEDAIMRFRSGLLNRGRMSFTAGNNVVEGSVINDFNGTIVVAGFETSLSFQDEVFNDGIIDVAPESSVVNYLGGYTNGPTGVVQIALGGDSVYSPHSSVGGDLTLLGGVLSVDIWNDPATGTAPLDPQAGDFFEIFSATGDLTGTFAIQDFSNAPLDPGLTWFVDYNQFFDTVTLRVSSLMPIGADFNGDGIVDRLDLLIWQQNFGIQMGATGLQGDANGDGAVDGLDYRIILDRFGMSSGAGSGTAVPEPSSLALLAIAAIAGLGWHRRVRR
ncbi:MAG: dockerin type I domain-containing protein [Pirellulales bacterium]